MKYRKLTGKRFISIICNYTFMGMRLLLMWLFYLQAFVAQAAPHHYKIECVSVDHDRSQVSPVKYKVPGNSIENINSADIEEEDFDFVTVKAWIFSWSVRPDIVQTVAFYRYYHCIDRPILFHALLC